METKRRLVYVILTVCLLCAMVTQLTSGTERVADVPYNNAGIKVFSQEFAESYHVLFVDGNDLYIGAVHTEQEDGPGYVFKVPADNINETVAEEVFEVKNNTGTGAIACRAYSTTPEKSCRNFIKVVMTDEADQSKLLVCGTNAEWPRCYHVVKESFGTEPSDEGFLGNFKCPRKQEETVTAIFGQDKKLYTGLVQDTSKPAIARSPTSNQSTELQTEDDSKWLNGAEFISSYKSDDTEEVLFFFRETANENENQYPEELTYSRVAKVCEKDEGGNVNVLNGRWSSFLKARLDCSVTNGDPYTEYQQFYNVLEDSVKIDVNGNEYVYAIFSGQRNGVSMPALCIYDVEKMSAIFDSGDYWDQQSVGLVWKEVTPGLAPKPGECVDNSTSLTDNVLNALKQHPLMAGLIPCDESPLLTSYTGVRFTQIVNTMVGEEIILFIGTDRGTVMKVDYNDGDPFVLEEVQVSEEGSPVTVMTKSDNDKSLYIGFDDKVVQVPMYQCHRYTTCSECNGAGDPHCGWDETSKLCVLDISSSVDHTCSEAPVWKQVQLGQTVLISCAVRSLEWTVKSVSIHEDCLKYINLDGIGLVITDFQESNAGLYEAKRPGGTDVICSMYLWITEPVGDLDFLEPKLEDQNKGTCQGRVVNLFCNAIGPADGFTITWKTPNGSVVADESRVQWANVVNCNNSRRGVSWLAVEVSADSNGTYTCEISDGTPKTATAEVTLQDCVTETSLECQKDRYLEASEKHERLQNATDCTTPTPTPGNESCQCKIEVIDCNDCCTGEGTCPAN